MAVLSVVLAAIAIISCAAPLFGLVFGLIALPVAIIALASKKTKGQQTDLKVVGLVLSILAVIGGFLSTAFFVNSMLFVFETVGEMSEQIENMPEDERVQELMANLYSTYIEIAMTNKLSKEEITREEAYDIYIAVLKSKHRDLYNEGYDIRVDENLKFEIVSPEAQKI